VQCAAARRLLQCSESLVFLTELKDARLALANVSATVVPTLESSNNSSSSSSSGDLLGGAPAFAVNLSSDGVALFVSVEAEQQAGRFNGSGLLLLPWQPQTLLFFPTEGEGAANATTDRPVDAGSGSSGGGQAPATEGQAPAVEGQAPAAASDALPAGSIASISVYWLQQALTTLQPPPISAAEPAASASSSSGRPATLLMLCIAYVLFIL